MIARTVPIGAVAALVIAATSVGVSAHAPATSQIEQIETATAAAPIAEAQRLFYNARYEEAAALLAGLCTRGATDLTGCELRSASLLFQIKRALGPEAGKDQAWERCGACPALTAAFVAETAIGQAAARARLRADPLHEASLFFLGKLDLNYVWLQLGLRGRRTGWSEYREARRSLDKVVERNPGHVRARVARAWIDYIVDTKMPRGTKWLLGGGNKMRGLAAVREAAATDAEAFVHAEARFALWDMLARERNFAEAVPLARELVREFPDNRDLTTFLEAHDSAPSR